MVFMNITSCRKLSKSSTVYILKQIREYFKFPIGCLLEIHATDETEGGQPVIMIKKVERKEVEKNDG